jgi:hypothetical protein
MGRARTEVRLDRRAVNEIVANHVRDMVFEDAAIVSGLRSRAVARAFCAS